MKVVNYNKASLEKVRMAITKRYFTGASEEARRYSVEVNAFFPPARDAKSNGSDCQHLQKFCRTYRDRTTVVPLPC
jgi:hypothetical protein